MADYKVTDVELTAVANAIRTKGGTQANLEWSTGFVSAINAIDTSGSSAVVQSLNITQNGIYTPPAGVDGYAPVTVEVSETGNTVLCEMDFTKANFALNNVTFNSNGASFTGTNGYILLPFAKSNITIEVNVASMSLSSGGNRRFIMADPNNGFIYRSSGKWGVYLNGWQDTDITDGRFFNNSIVKVYIDSQNLWHIYKDNVLVFEPSQAYGLKTSGFSLGSSSDSINNTVITKVRIY